MCASIIVNGVKISFVHQNYHALGKAYYFKENKSLEVRTLTWVIFLITGIRYYKWQFLVHYCSRESNLFQRKKYFQSKEKSWLVNLYVITTYYLYPFSKPSVVKILTKSIPVNLLHVLHLKMRGKQPLVCTWFSVVFGLDLCLIKIN